MKINTIFLFLFFSFSIYLAYSQPYARFLNNKQWAIEQMNPGPGCHCYTNYWWVADGDTILQDKKYTSIRRHDPPYVGPPIFLREDSTLRRVYELTDSGEIVFLSFNSTTRGQTDTIYGRPCTLDTINDYYRFLRAA